MFLVGKVLSFRVSANGLKVFIGDLKKGEPSLDTLRPPRQGFEVSGIRDARASREVADLAEALRDLPQLPVLRLGAAHGAGAHRLLPAAGISVATGVGFGSKGSWGPGGRGGRRRTPWGVTGEGEVSREGGGERSNKLVRGKRDNLGSLPLRSLPAQAPSPCSKGKSSQGRFLRTSIFGGV